MQMLPLNFRWSFHSFIVSMCVLPATGSCGVNMVQVHSPSGVNSVNRWLRKSACCLIPDFCFNGGCGEGGKCWWKPERLSGAVGISGSDGGWGICPELGRSWSWGGNCFNWQRVKYRAKASLYSFWFAQFQTLYTTTADSLLLPPSSEQGTQRELPV